MTSSIFDGSASIHSDVSVVLGIDTHVGNAGSRGEQFGPFILR
jgi:hypothetical protein